MPPDILKLYRPVIVCRNNFSTQLFMKVKVLFFGATADTTGKRSDEVEITEPASSRKAFDQVLAKYPDLSSHKLLFSVNQEYANGTEALRENDELAIFTAVSGG
jgi:molybdopterin converting factor small subunit